MTTNENASTGDNQLVQITMQELDSLTMAAEATLRVVHHAISDGHYPPPGNETELLAKAIDHANELLRSYRVKTSRWIN